jgi:rieske iron-sulfur protein
VPRSADSIRRRCLLKSVCALGLALPRIGRSDEPAASEPPEENDLLVFAFGDREGQAVSPGDLIVGAEQIFAYAQQADTGIVRNGTRLYQIALVRLDPSWLSEDTAARAVDGVVAYSGVCTHTGCDVTDWHDDIHQFQCPCHESQFDPSDGARVVGGPAPWPLAALPLKLVDGKLAVAGPFEGRLGFLQPGQSPFGI